MKKSKRLDVVRFDHPTVVDKLENIAEFQIISPCVLRTKLQTRYYTEVSFTYSMRNR